MSDSNTYVTPADVGGIEDFGERCRNGEFCCPTPDDDKVGGLITNINPDCPYPVLCCCDPTYGRAPLDGSACDPILGKCCFCQTLNSPEKFDSEQAALDECEKETAGLKRCPGAVCGAAQRFPGQTRFYYTLVVERCEDNIVMGTCNENNALTPGIKDTFKFTALEFCNPDGTCGGAFNPPFNP